MTSREDELLPPIDQSISNENDWWEFDLTEVKVLRPGKKLYANLLEATEDNPVQVIGELQLKPSQEHLLLDPEVSSRRIIIDNVTHYAYGQMEDRSVELWVAGNAGWYRISPAKGYLPSYNRMVQAVDMYYFLMDRHSEGKKRLNPTFKNLCEQYVFHTHGDCETREQSSQAFDLHGPFLLRCMIEDDDDMDWDKTNVLVHLRRKFKDEYKEIMDRIYPQSESENEDEDEDEPNLKTPRHDPAAISNSQTDAVYNLIIELREEGLLAKRRLHVDLLAERFSERYSFSKENSEKIITARASAVLEKLDEEAENGFRWSRYVIHRELTHAASNPEPLPPALLTPLQSHYSTDADADSDDEALTRTQKSVLRPRKGAVSAKVMGKRNRSGLADEPMTQSDNEEQEQDDDDPDLMSDVETPSKSRGHDLIRTPLASARPRTRSFTAKSGSAASLLQAMLKENQPTPPPIASSLPIAKRKQPKEKEPEQPYIPPLPDVDGTTDPESTSEIEHETDHEEEPEPEPEPEIWNCRMQGCQKAITTKGEERQKEISEHAGEHDWESQMRIELVETEHRMHSTLPVSNLMRFMLNQHLQQMREAFPEIYPANGTNATNTTA